MKNFIKIPITNLLVKNKNKEKKLFYQLVDEEGNLLDETNSFLLKRRDGLYSEIGKTFKRKKRNSEHLILDNLEIESCQYRSYRDGSIDFNPSFDPTEATKTPEEHSKEEIEAYNLKIEKRIEKEIIREQRQKCEREIMALEKKIDELDEKLGRK